MCTFFCPPEFRLTLVDRKAKQSEGTWRWSLKFTGLDRLCSDRLCSYFLTVTVAFPCLPSFGFTLPSREGFAWNAEESLLLYNRSLISTYFTVLSEARPVARFCLSGLYKCISVSKSNNFFAKQCLRHYFFCRKRIARSTSETSSHTECDHGNQTF